MPLLRQVFSCCVCLAGWAGWLGAAPAFAQAASQTSPARAGAYYPSFDSTRIYYQVQGQGPAVVLLHGFTSTLDAWKNTPLVQQLLTQG